ncbi:MAG: hypothetical protein ABIH82_03395 [Candidatus Woesearchaeota archaeon]
MYENINLDGRIQKIDECSLERRMDHFKEVPEVIVHREQHSAGDFILQDGIYYVTTSGKLRYNEIQIGFYADGPNVSEVRDTVMRKRNPKLESVIGATLMGALGVYIALTCESEAPIFTGLLLPLTMAASGYLVSMMLFGCGDGDSKAWKSYQAYRTDVGKSK